jgi:hypothetical protein
MRKRWSRTRDNERPYWLADGSGLIYLRDGKCLRYDVKTRVEKILFDIFPAKINQMGFAEGRIYFTRTVAEGDLWIGHIDRP